MPPFGDAVAEGLLDEDVLARLERPHRGEGVPVVGRHDGDGVDLGIFEDAAEVAVGFRLVPARLLDDGDRAIDVRAIDVADRSDSHVRVREELPQPARAHPADADHAQDDLIVRLLARQDAPVQRGQREAACHRTEEHAPRD